MKPENLIAVYQGAEALENGHPDDSKELKKLKKHEIRNLQSLCMLLKYNGCKTADFDGYFVGYTIKQISKEFDLIRFGDNYTINIEIKSELKVANKIEKIAKQMQKNYYYLKLIQHPIFIFVYVENDGFYKFLIEEQQCIKCDIDDLIRAISKQNVNYSIDPDMLFIPSNFLISPFNSTDKFINGDYFLTTQQDRIKEEIFADLTNSPMSFFTISANAGTGKTLLLYDIAKTFINNNKRIKVIHCGKLNQGHNRLISAYNWDISPISSIPQYDPMNFLNLVSCFRGYNMIFVDESQRIRLSQLEFLANVAIYLKIPMIFSYDVKQFLRDGESLDLTDYLLKKYPQISCTPKKLTNKIRTNKAMASFITNLIEIGKSKDNLDYSDITVEYYSEFSDALKYINFLKRKGWKIITFTTSLMDPEKDPYYSLSSFSDTNAHDVIGQEFPKVAFVMDHNFMYENGKLKAQYSYYSASGMLYQIITRVVNELKIIVFDNQELYYNLLFIKKMGETK